MQQKKSGTNTSTRSKDITRNIQFLSFHILPFLYVINKQGIASSISDILCHTQQHFQTSTSKSRMCMSCTQWSVLYVQIYCFSAFSIDLFFFLLCMTYESQIGKVKTLDYDNTLPISFIQTGLIQLIKHKETHKFKRQKYLYT